MNAMLAYIVSFAGVYSNFTLYGSYLFSDLVFCALLILFLLPPFCLADNDGKWASLGILVFATIIDYIQFDDTRAVLSQLRFVFGFLVMCTLVRHYKRGDRGSGLTTAYTQACLIYSIAIILQCICYYFLKINIDLDLGFEQREINVAGLYDPSQSSLYRTGGFFKEPSWFAAFVGPSLQILYTQKKWYQFVGVVSALLLSTSALGYIFVIVFVLSNISLTFIFKFIFFGLSFFIVLNNAMPEIFIRLYEVGETGGSIVIRVIEPFTNAFTFERFTLFGNESNFHFADGEYKFYANTFVYIYLYFGIIGLIVFLREIFKLKHPFFIVSILLLIIIEGLYGRIEFWVLLAVISVYVYESDKNGKSTSMHNSCAHESCKT